MTDDADSLLNSQIAYYRARAAEYDRVYTEREDLQEVLACFGELPITGDVLELACGTGQWTRLLAERARSVTALDAAPEVLAIAKERAASANVRFIETDVFAWRPERRYDTVFFAFWLSHVPPSRLAAFWDTVGAALTPQGSAVFIDTGPGEAAQEEVVTERDVPVVRRRLDDGSEHHIVKVFHEAGQLTTDLAALGWEAQVRPVGGNYLIGVAHRGIRPGQA